MTNDDVDTSTGDSVTTSGPGGTSRRALLAGFGGLGLLGLTGTASAGDGDHLTQTWDGDPGTPGLTIDVGSNTSRAYVGATADPEGIAIQGVAHDDSGRNKGIEGKTKSSDGIGLLGNAVAETGGAKGLEGRSAAKYGTGVIGVAQHSEGPTKGVRGLAKSPEGFGVEGINTAGSGTTYGVRGEVESDDGYGLYTPDSAKVDGTIEVGGDLQVSGVKNFVQTVSTDAGPQDVVYTSVESGTPRTETTDVAELTDGVAVVELPDHFSMVTSSEEPLSVQVTPYADEQVHPQVTDRSTERVVVKDLGDGPDEYEFAYTVKGVRAGYEDQAVVRD